MSHLDPYGSSQDVEMSDDSPFGHPGLLHYADPEDMDELIGVTTAYDHPSSGSRGGRNKPDVPVLHEKFSNKFNDLFDEELLGRDGRLAQSGAASGPASAGPSPGSAAPSSATATASQGQHQKQQGAKPSEKAP